MILSRSVRLRLFLLAALVQGAAEPGRADGGGFDAIRPLLQTYCVRCHRPDKKFGGIDFASITSAERAAQAGAVWEEVVARVRDREMPPKGNKQPTEDEHDKLLAWARSAAAKTLDCRHVASDRTQHRYRGHVMSRRLSRAEYNNSIRDLIGLDLRPADRLPSDGSGGEGFDNNGDALFTSAIHIEKYLDAAEDVLRAVLPAAKEPDDTRPVRLPPEAIAAARRRLLIAAPGPDVSPREAARRIVARFAARAFRRPVTGREVDRLLTVFDRAVKRGDSFEAALKLPLKAVLISPHFLFLVEPEPDKEGDYELSDYPLAARLSYFLWASMPDDELTSLASHGQLRNNGVLRGQVRRMLKDPRSRGLAEDFAVQWLGLRSLGDTVRPDPQRFPEFDDELATSMRQEAVLLFDHLLREDRSLLELLDSDYTFANETLAALYGLKDVKGSRMRRVRLDGRTRGGVLGMAGVLAVTSYALRTSPVLRGKWVLENLLGARVPPPPPNAGQLPRDGKDPKGLPFRKQLELHRTRADCASCHQRMDPLGFGLENFDPIGRYRTRLDGTPIDAAGVLPSGEKFNGPHELRRLLLRRKDEFLRNLARKLLGYALGRPLYKFDRCVIEECLKALESGGYRAPVLIERIVLSYPFRHRYAKK